MAMCHEHNLRAPPPAAKPFGIRATLRPSDPFAKLVGGGWQKLHWFATAGERDAALEDMASRHVYSRAGDQPAVDYEKVEAR